jgi:hypothetical protein
MRRITLVVMVTVIMAAILVLIAGSVLAMDTQQKQTYVDTVETEQYFALPGRSRPSNPFAASMQQQKPFLTRRMGDFPYVLRPSS